MLLRWWRQHDDYEWRIDFLRNSGLLPVLRYVIAGIGATMGTLAAVNVFIPPNADGLLTRIGWAVVAVGSVGWAARWALLPWPTARQSAALVVFVDALMTLSVVLFCDPHVAMSGIPLLLCAGGYVVFFHGPRLHLVHIAWCAASVVGVAAWLASTTLDHGLQLAASRAVIALLVTVCILPALQFGFWLLQGSSMQSLTDPLTELTNRRGLAVSVKRLTEGVHPDAHLCALFIDVDGFKRVNDTLGHTVGDDVLIRTARRIRAVSAQTPSSCAGRRGISGGGPNSGWSSRDGRRADSFGGLGARPAGHYGERRHGHLHAIRSRPRRRHHRCRFGDVRGQGPWRQPASSSLPRARRCPEIADRRPFLSARAHSGVPARQRHRRRRGRSHRDRCRGPRRPARRPRCPVARLPRACDRA